MIKATLDMETYIPIEATDLKLIHQEVQQKLDIQDQFEIFFKDSLKLYSGGEGQLLVVLINPLYKNPEEYLSL